MVAYDILLRCNTGRITQILPILKVVTYPKTDTGILTYMLK